MWPTVVMDGPIRTHPNNDPGGASSQRSACIRRLIYDCPKQPTRGRSRSGMAKLVYVANVSLDGFIEDAQGRFGWTEPSDDVFTFITGLVRPMGTHLYGRRLYETMAVWELDPDLAAGSELMADFARTWQAADKVVYSTTLQTIPTGRARLERRFDPDAVRELKASAASDVVIGGATIAARAFDAGLIDECHHFVYPVLVGAGKSAFSGDGPVQMTLLEEQRFDSGVVYLRYRIMS